MSQYLLLKQGTIHNAVDEEAFVADILIEDGKIKKIAPVLEGKVINEAAVIDAMGIDVYPGFVDAHCHLGLDGYAVGFAGQDFNELGDPMTPQLSAIDAINPQDETFRMAREGGVTCVSTGPGSSECDRRNLLHHQNVWKPRGRHDCPGKISHENCIRRESEELL